MFFTISQKLDDSEMTQQKHYVAATSCHVISGWRRGSVVRTSVCSWRTFPDLRLIHGNRFMPHLFGGRHNVSPLV